MNRITKKFRELSEIRRSALIGYMTAGFPSLDFTGKLVMTMESSGVDIIELGVPFSDPVADGPVIQRASEYALRRGITLSGVINFVKGIRKITEIPVLLMGYYNPILSYGVEDFVKDASCAGVDGLIVPDLPPEESGELIKHAREYGLATIFLLAPTSTESRIRAVARVSRGFLYYVSLTGVTGSRSRLPAGIANNIRRIKRFTNLPVCVGFGVSTPEHVRMLGKVADGVIVGSAIIKIIQENRNYRRSIKNIRRFLSSLHASIRL